MKGNKGFAFLETIVALGLLGIVVVAAIRAGVWAGTELDISCWQVIP